MAKVDLYNEDILRQIAIDHYERNISQSDIAESLGISRPSVTEALKRARALGIIKITIPRDKERQPTLNRLQTAMLRRFRVLEDVELVLGHIDVEGSLAPSVVPDIAKAAAIYLEGELLKRLKNDQKTRLAVSGGRRFIRQVVQNLNPKIKLPNLEVYPISGFIREQANNGDPSLLAYDIATLYEAKYAWLPIPAIVDTRKQLGVAKELPIVRDVLESVERANLYLISLFAPYSDDLVTRGILKKEQIKKISQDAVCNIDMWFYTAQGVCLNNTISDPPFYLTGYDINNLSKKIEKKNAKVVLIAGGSETKSDGTVLNQVAGIRAMLEAKLINVLITDHTTARGLLNDI